MRMQEFSGYFKTVSVGVFLIGLPLLYGSFNHMFRNEILYCATLLFMCSLIIAGFKSSFVGKFRGTLDCFVFLFLLCGILNSILIKNGEIDRFIIYKWAAVASCYFAVKQLHSHKIILYSLVVSGVAQSIVTFFQKSGTLASHNIMFDACGSFGNPGQLGGYLAVCIVVSICLLTGHLKNKTKWAAGLLAASLMVQFVAFYMADSRAACVGLTAGVLVFFIPSAKKHKSLLTGIAIVAVMAICTALYSYRPASANGRLLIWRVSTEMVADKPLFGHGIGAFSEKYMLYQATYFSENPNSVFVPVADNAPFPFNELLNITIQQGIIGLSLLLAVLYVAFHTKGNRIFKAALAALLAFSMFSYPTEVFPILLLFAVCLGGLSPQITQISSDKNNVKFILRMSLYMVVCYFSIKNIVFLHHLSTNIFDNKQYEKMRYNRTYHNYYMDWLVDQPTSDYTKRLKNILPSCENYCLLAEYFLAKKDYKQAETTLRIAADMIPTRIRPNYLLWQLYMETENMPAALETAQKIVKTPVKIESTYTLKVKAQMKKQLE